MSEFTLYMMLIFLPGIIAYKVFDVLTEHRERKVYEVILFSFLFGFLSYFLYWILIILLFGAKSKFHFFTTLIHPEFIDFNEILSVSCFAILLGLGATVLDTYKVLHRISLFLRITKKHGELDTFSYLMNSNLRKNVWIIIRDMQDNRAYYGWLHAYSAGHEKNELFLVDVIVYENSRGIQIMQTPSIYPSKPKENYVIEFPELGYNIRGKIGDNNV